MMMVVCQAMAQLPRNPDRSVNVADLREEVAAMYRAQGVDDETAQRRAKAAINAATKDPW